LGLIQKYGEPVCRVGHYLFWRKGRDIFEVLEASIILPKESERHTHKIIKRKNGK
jgi:hypothetical protein